jgi:hypothetical protein
MAHQWARLAQASALPLARSSHSLTAIGRALFLFGGEHAPRVPIDDGPCVHRYDLDAVEPCWRALQPASAAAPRPCARVAHTAAAVGDSFYVFGGRRGVDEKVPLDDLWSFCTSALTWRQLEHAGGPPARSYHASCALGTSVYIFGGCGTGGRLSDLWRYDTVAALWEQMPSSDAISGRGGACLAAHGASLYVAAGFDGKSELCDLHAFDTVTRTWRVLEAASTSMTPRSVAALGVVGDALVLFGGEAEVSAAGHAGAGRFNNDAWAWRLGSDAANAGWTLVQAAGEAPAPRGWLACASVPGLGLLVHGGNSDSNERLDDMYVLKEAA